MSSIFKVQVEDSFENDAIQIISQPESTFTSSLTNASHFSELPGTRNGSGGQDSNPRLGDVEVNDMHSGPADTERQLENIQQQNQTQVEFSNKEDDSIPLQSLHTGSNHDLNGTAKVNLNLDGFYKYG